MEGADDLRGLPPVVAEAPAESLSKKQKRVPFLTGVTSAETSRAVFGRIFKQSYTYYLIRFGSLMAVLRNSDLHGHCYKDRRGTYIKINGANFVIYKLHN